MFDTAVACFVTLAHDRVAGLTLRGLLEFIEWMTGFFATWLQKMRLHLRRIRAEPDPEPPIL
jgi:hypothetical protein